MLFFNVVLQMSPTQDEARCQIVVCLLCNTITLVKNLCDLAFLSTVSNIRSVSSLLSSIDSSIEACKTDHTL